MNCPSVEQWHLLSMDALDEAQRDALQAHAEQCADCRTAFGRARQDHARLQRAFEVFGRRHDELRDRLMTAVPAALAEGSAVRRRPSMWSGWRNAIGGLSTSPSRIAAILVPAAGLLIALGVWLMPARSTLAFGAVLQHMRVARTMACDYTMTSTAVYEAEDRTEQNEYHGELSMYSDGAVRAWRLNQTDPSGVEWIFPDHSVRIDADGKRTVTTYTEHPGTFRIQETPEWWLARLMQLSGMPDRQLWPHPAS